MPNETPAAEVCPRAITGRQRARLIALLSRLTRTNVRSYGKKMVLDDGFECVVRGDIRAITAQIYRRRSAKPGISITLSRSVNGADLKRLREGLEPERYSLKMARRMERREKTLNDIASQIVGNPDFAELIGG